MLEEDSASISSSFTNQSITAQGRSNLSGTPFDSFPHPVPLSPSSTENATLTELWYNALLPYLGTRLVLVLVGLLANFYLLPLTINNAALHQPFPQVLWLMWTRFDSGFYLDIAHSGYKPVEWAFYPLYPLLISGVGRLLGGTYTAFHLAGFLISNFAAIIAMAYLYLLVRKEWDRVVAGRTVLYLALFPMSFYLSAVYTEALFLALAVACIYYARKQSWWLAGICGALAALCRSQGMMLLVPLAWEYLRVLSERYAPPPSQLPQELSKRTYIRIQYYIRGLYLAACQLKNWFTAGALALVPVGLLAFMLYGWGETGDFKITFHINRTLWGRQLSSPWYVLIDSLQHPTLGDPMNWNFWLLNIIVAFAFLGFTIMAFRRLPLIYAFFTLVMVVLPLSTNRLNSLARYYVIVFPVFILLALLCPDNKPNRHTFILVFFTAIQALLMAFFVIGMYTIA